MKYPLLLNLDAIAQGMRPYRKAKRIRTAFSPTQLLRLESAFEVNHYVVGQERKRLAESLDLTETQVSILAVQIFRIYFSKTYIYIYTY